MCQHTLFVDLVCDETIAVYVRLYISRTSIPGMLRNYRVNSVQLSSS